MTESLHKVFNKKKLTQRYQGDTDLVLELCQVFLEDLTEKTTALEKAMSAENLDDLIRVAHSLKGSTGTVTAEASCDLALNLEMAARDGDFAKAREIYPNLLKSLGEAEKAMRAEVLSD